MANDIFSRMAQGPGNLQQEDYNNWNQMVGSAPPDQFQQAASQAIRQTDPNEYAQHVQPGVNGTDPLGSLGSGILGSVASTLLGQLTQRGVSQGQLQNQAGVPNLNPSQMSPQDVAQLLQYAQQNHPEALAQVATQYRNNPDIVSSILNNKALMGLAIGLGAQYLSQEEAKNRKQ